MKSKTLSIINKYKRELLEQADPNASPEGEVPMGDPAAAAPAEEAEPQTLQMTSDAEDTYISTIIDAALFEPSTVTPEQRRALLDVQEIMMNKSASGVTNAREEVLPVVMAIISGESDQKGFKKKMNAVD